MGAADDVDAVLLEAAVADATVANAGDVAAKVDVDAVSAVVVDRSESASAAQAATASMASNIGRRHRGLTRPVYHAE